MFVSDVWQYGGIDTRSDEGLTAEFIKKQMTDTEWQKVYEMSKDRQLYSNLCSSLFPTIHGNDEVKRGILLMLLGGVAKETGEGTHLRGDINVCIVGDPSTAKSNFLKCVPDAVFSSSSPEINCKTTNIACTTCVVNLK